MHPAITTALVFMTLALLMLVKPCEAQTVQVYCRGALGNVMIFSTSCPPGYTFIGVVE